MVKLTIGYIEYILVEGWQDEADVSTGTERIEFIKMHHSAGFNKPEICDDE